MLLGANALNVSDISTLRYCENDVTAVSEALSSKKVGFEVTKLGGDSLPTEVVSKFEYMAERCVPGDSLIFYFSGHGYLRRGQLYLVLDNSNLDSPVSTCIPVSLIKTIFANTQASLRMMVLDCCHSGAAAESVYTKSTAASISDSLSASATENASLILAACGRTATTREVAEFEMGVLSNFLVSALSNEFDAADVDNDGMLSVSDLMSYIHSKVTQFNESNPLNRLNVPELYGEVRSGVYLTVEPLGEVHELKQRLEEQILKAVEKLRLEFNQNDYVEPKRLTSLARPLNTVAPTLTDLSILDELFNIGDDAAIFAAATILQKRRDPRYMRKLVPYVDAPYDSLRGAANWRVIRAIRDSGKVYDFSTDALDDLKMRLKRASTIRATKNGEMFGTGTTLNMIVQVCKRLKIDKGEVLSKEQLNHLKAG